MLVLAQSEEDNLLLEVKNIVADLRDELQKTKYELETTKTKLKKIEEDVSSLKNPPFAFFCALHDDITDINYNDKPISYSKLLYLFTNAEGGGLDLGAGAFTAPHPGTYTADFSLVSYNDAGYKNNVVSLQNNGQVFLRSGILSSEGNAKDQGARTIHLHLDRGDTLVLFCELCSDGIGHITFCVNLSQFDIE